ncbi:MAG: hypothetical protein ACOYM7_02710 [Paludibacter sp.]
MSKQLKTNNMATTKTLYVNNEAVEFEMTALQNTLNEVKRVKNYLIDSDLLITPGTILQACEKQFNTIIALSKEPEMQKMYDFNEKVGSNDILNEMTLQRINEKGEALNQKLLAGLPPMGKLAKHYLQYINCETMEIVPGVREIFIEKHSIKVDAEMAQQHENLINALNYFFELYPEQPTNLIMERLFKKIGLYEREIEMDLYYYDSQKLCRDWVQLRANNML